MSKGSDLERLAKAFEVEPDLVFESVEGEFGYPVELIGITPEEASPYLKAHEDYVQHERQCMEADESPLSSEQ
jgi:hypothetical protein